MQICHCRFERWTQCLLRAGSAQLPGQQVEESSARELVDKAQGQCPEGQGLGGTGVPQYLPAHSFVPQETGKGGQDRPIQRRPEVPAGMFGFASSIESGVVFQAQLLQAATRPSHEPGVLLAAASSQA